MAKRAPVTADTLLPPDDREALVARQSDFKTLVAQLEHLVIQSDDEEAYFVDLENRIALAARGVEERKRSFTDPLKDVVRRFDALFKPTLDEAKAARSKITAAVGAYRQAKARALREQAAPVVPVVASLPQPLPPTPQIRVEVVDVRHVPPEFLIVSVDWAKVQAAVYAGAREIPGLRIVRE
jgi:hypothetical protein